MQSIGIAAPAARLINAYDQWQNSDRGSSAAWAFRAQVVHTIAKTSFELIARFTLVLTASVSSLGLAWLSRRFRNWGSEQLVQCRELVQMLPQYLQGLKQPGSLFLTQYHKIQSQDITRSLLQLRQRVMRRLETGRPLELISDPAHSSSHSVYWVDDTAGYFGVVKGFFANEELMDAEIVNNPHIASSKLERLHYKLAVIAGFGSLFVPTIGVDVQTKDGRRFIGSCQANQRRWGRELLSTYLDRMKEEGWECRLSSLKREHVIRATVCSLFFGMYDAHGRNVFYDESEAKLYFFDNARLGSLTNVGRRNGKLYSNYRCDLLQLPQARQKLTAENQQFIRAELSRLRKSIPEIRRYLLLERPSRERHEGALGLLNLPPGWMDVEAFVNGLETRVAQLEASMDLISKLVDGGSLVDLVSGAQPEWRYLVGAFLAVQLASHPGRYETDSSWVSDLKAEVPAVASMWPFDVLLIHLVKHKIDPYAVREIAQKASSFEQLFRELHELVDGGGEKLAHEVLLDHRRQILRELDKAASERHKA